ncbi:response regulator transcription factor [Geosporobacter ferrireducens]|uniref:response regulator transcription factor n=1 Tax=Geosporobacter ferrireducens TaxID=1424294 RepID=UPI00139B8F20|nr:response regulator transcription factor [Geosporobacter ferrireducens]MTI54250.1 response regulator transcription factor [Geosporobacter ferrireducens]
MEKKTILVVDDELKIRILLKDFLEREGFIIIESPDGKHALDTFQNSGKNIDLILLDVMLPEYDGWTVCREIRKVSQVPIIMLTARSEDFDEVHGFEIGADDYVKKPVKPTALIARINAFFRRIDNGKTENKILAHGGLEINDAAHTVKVENEEIILSPKEYALLLFLVEHKGRIISREQLLNLVWGYEYYGSLRTVDTHINRLRIKLGKKGDAITTIRGFGYRFEG